MLSLINSLESDKQKLQEEVKQAEAAAVAQKAESDAEIVKLEEAQALAMQIAAEEKVKREAADLYADDQYAARMLSEQQAASMGTLRVNAERKAREAIQDAA